MGTSGGTPEGASILHHWTHKLLVQQNSTTGGKSTSPVYEISQHSLSMYCCLSHLIHMSRISRATPMDWLPEELNRSRFWDIRLPALAKSMAEPFKKLIVILHFLSH